jgi:hypothetical protein
MGEAETGRRPKPTAPGAADTAEPDEPIELDSAGVYYISVEDFERRAPPRPVDEPESEAE